jgi:hypothetical protein
MVQPRRVRAVQARLEFDGLVLFPDDTAAP